MSSFLRFARVVLASTGSTCLSCHSWLVVVRCESVCRKFLFRFQPTLPTLSTHSTVQLSTAQHTATATATAGKTCESRAMRHRLFSYHPIVLASHRSASRPLGSDRVGSDRIWLYLYFLTCLLPPLLPYILT